VLDPVVSLHIIMQAPPADQAEAIIPMEIVSNEDANLNGTVKISRKAAKRTLPWDLNAEELLLLSSQPPQAEDIPAARKKQRLDEPLPTTTTTDEAARKTASNDLSEEHSPSAADNYYTKTDADPVTTDTQTNAGETRATARWTLEEDAKLTSAVANTRKKKHRGEYAPDWVAVAALVPGRTQIPCRKRWCNALDPSIDRTNERAGKWAEDEDSMLKDAVQRHGGKDWVAISALVPGRTKKQCWSRWKCIDPNSRTVREREHGILKKAPALGLEPHIFRAA
jgi:hypothetical protein